MRSSSPGASAGMNQRPVRAAGRRARRWAISSAFIALAVCSTALATEKPALSFNPASAAHGERLAQACLSCHGVEGSVQGNPPTPVPRLRGQREEVIFDALRAYKDGSRKSDVMGPQARSLSLQDMRDLGAYLSGSGPYLPRVHDTATWAHQKVHRDCTICHGESGMGVMDGVPVLTGQRKDYLIYALDAYRQGRRKDPVMRSMAGTLTTGESEKLGAYFANEPHLEVAR